MNEVLGNVPYFIVSTVSFNIVDASESFINEYGFTPDIINKKIDKVLFDKDIEEIINFKDSELIDLSTVLRVKNSQSLSFVKINKITINEQVYLLFYLIPLSKGIVPNLLSTKYQYYTELYNMIYFLEKVQNIIENSCCNSVLIAVKIENITGLINNIGFYEFYNLSEILYSRILSLNNKNTIISCFNEDKFLIFINDILSEEDIIVYIYNEIISLLEKPIIYKNNRWVLTFKYGVAFSGKDGETAEELVINALMAISCDTNKLDSISFYNSNVYKTSEKVINLKKDIMEALEKEELLLFYQPYYCLQTGLIKGAEALLRWEKKGKLIPPIEFIPYLEQLGLIVAVEEWMVEKASLLAKKLKQMGLHLTLSLNISPDSFNLRSFTDFSIYKVSKEYDVSNYIVFEITERLIIQDIANTSYTVKRLRENGISISVDDFGTGYSSLSNLACIDIDLLKIDMSFTKKLMENGKIEKIITNIVSLSHSLGAKVIAEGVENEDVCNKLRTLGCDCGQGYFWSKPINELEFLQLAERHYIRG